jgi:hypothetical protein
MQKTQEQLIAEGNLNAALNAPVASEVNKPALSSIAERGKADGVKLAEGNKEYASKLANLAHNVLWSAGEFLKGKEQDTREYLSGYRLAFDEKSAKVRASEARAFLDAFNKEPEKVKAIANSDEGYHRGIGYHDMIAECRKIRGKRIETKERTPKLTDKGAETVAERIAVATLPQAEAIAANAVRQIVATAKADWEQAVVRQIDALASQLSRSKEPIYQVFAEEIMVNCGEILQTGSHTPERLEQAEQQAKAA